MSGDRSVSRAVTARPGERSVRGRIWSVACALPAPLVEPSSEGRIRSVVRAWGARLVERVDSAIVALAGRQHGLVAARQLRAVGLDSRAIARRVERGWLSPQGGGVFQAGAIAGPCAREMAALLRCGIARRRTHPHRRREVGASTGRARCADRPHRRLGNQLPPRAAAAPRARAGARGPHDPPRAADHDPGEDDRGPVRLAPRRRAPAAHRGRRSAAA